MSEWTRAPELDCLKDGIWSAAWRNGEGKLRYQVLGIDYAALSRAAPSEAGDE